MHLQNANVLIWLKQLGLPIFHQSFISYAFKTDGNATKMKTFLLVIEIADAPPEKLVPFISSSLEKCS